MLRPSPNHGTQRLPNDDDDHVCMYSSVCMCVHVYVLYVCMYVCVYLCMCMCRCIYVY